MELLFFEDALYENVLLKTNTLGGNMEKTKDGRANKRN